MNGLNTLIFDNLVLIVAVILIGGIVIGIALRIKDGRKTYRHRR